MGTCDIMRLPLLRQGLGVPGDKARRGGHAAWRGRQHETVKGLPLKIDSSFVHLSSLAANSKIPVRHGAGMGGGTEAPTWTPRATLPAALGAAH